jgi:hypothetical protein
MSKLKATEFVKNIRNKKADICSSAMGQGVGLLCNSPYHVLQSLPMDFADGDILNSPGYILARSSNRATPKKWGKRASARGPNTDFQPDLATQK